MKRAKKLIAFLLAAVMVMSLSMTVLADDPVPGEGSITINGTDAVPITDRTFNAYKILDVELAGNTGNMAYTVPTELKDFYAEYFDDQITVEATDPTFDSLVVEEIGKWFQIPKTCLNLPRLH